MNLSIDAINWSGLVNRLKPLPWRLYAIVVIGAFLLASIASTVTGYFLMETHLKEIQRVQKIGAKTAEVSFVAPAETLTKQMLEAILERNIFNSQGEEESEEEKKPGSDAQKTTLPIKLVGLIYAGISEAGLALVENTQKRTINSFLVGDILLAEARLVEIQRDKILIDNRGIKEFAILEEQEIKRVTRRKGKPGASTGPAMTSNDGNPYATEPPPENFKEEGFERKGSDIELTLDYKNKLLGPEFATVLQDAKANPNIVDGRLEGFRMDRIRKNSFYEKAGIQNGDIVEEVNGVALTDTAQAVKTLQGLRNEPDIEVRVNRGGSRFTVKMKVK